MRRPAIEPVVWKAPRAGRRPPPSLPPLTVWHVNGSGAEDVLVDDKGNVYTGVDDGRVLRLTSDGRRLDTIADTGGRPLGLEHLPDGRLLVCDAKRGLLAVDRVTGAVETLVPRSPQLHLCNNAAVTADGTIYFTDSTQRFELTHWKADLLEHTGTGRFLRRTPDGTVDVLRSGLQFPNGVALAPDESFVVFAEMWEYRLIRLWLSGARAGEFDVIADNLPGFPDNISTGSDGHIWIAFANPRDPRLDLLLRTPPALRKALWRLPERLQPAEKKTVWVRAIDGGTGQVLHDFYGAGVGYHMVTGVREHDGRVYLGSLEERAVAFFDLP
ncbi:MULTISPECIES: SMP-30/gluconolactonase/LRE family protein [Actinokineospora]|uniref:Strictosidine synthase n=1 Tax=Actinokineospora fastidiosa TaxID=1816 RepID=A0A918GK62_9PSEU|nr:MULTISPECIES: SMP-30/gluconolactonase/LRE family protein [Actinokineospora]UVS77548.1 Gluconolactonase precursor [Actinokineospora sp. UTMC 2448]GGS42570.1 strictosidine synthase [Actinokineospora fastidiosa]